LRFPIADRFLKYYANEIEKSAGCQKMDSPNGLLAYFFVARRLDSIGKAKRLDLYIPHPAKPPKHAH
jgi:hypothetical protein